MTTTEPTTTTRPLIEAGLDLDAFPDFDGPATGCNCEDCEDLAAEQADTPAANWRDMPSYHTTAATMATKLRLLADALDKLGDAELSKTWMSVDFQVTGDADPAGRKAAVDAIAAALELGPVKDGRDTFYQPDEVRGVCVYTGKLHQPNCCEHCTLAAS